MKLPGRISLVFAFHFISDDNYKGCWLYTRDLQYDPTPVFKAALATTSSVDFYQGLSRAFRRFNDAHTRFFSPLQVFHYLRPMVLSTRLRKSPTAAPATQEVYLSAINPLYTLLNATRLVPHLATWSALIGRSVNTINGQPALAYLTVSSTLLLAMHSLPARNIIQ